MILPLIALLAAQEAVERDRHAWLRWKEGSYAKFAIEEPPGAGEEIQTLKRATGSEYDVHILRTIEGDVVRDRMDTRKARLDWAHLDPQAGKAGDEEVEVEGKRYRCTILKRVLEYPEQKARAEDRVWVAAGCAWPLREQHTYTGAMGYESEMVAEKLADEVAVGRARIACVKYASKTRWTRDRSTTASTVWYSLDVPGGLVKETTDLSTRVLVEFEAKK